MVAETRNGLTDYGRFAAALGIVWYYSQAPGHPYAYVSWPLFLVLLSMPAPPGLGQRARRLVLPFLTWSVVFAMLRTALALKNNDPPFGWWDWYMVWSGTWPHLWFLPFAFFALLVAPWFQHPLASLGTAWLIALLLCVKGTPDTLPLAQWSLGVIPVLVGIAYFSWGWRLAVITLLGSWLILQLGRPSPDNTTILLGTSLALLCFAIRLPMTALSDWCGRIAIWVYLAHPLVIITGQSLRITWFELGLFSVVGSVILAQILVTAVHTSHRSKLEF